MSLHPYRDEELNHFKCSSLVLNEFPKALRQTFKTMWDTTIGHHPGFHLWDDSTAVRNLFLSEEGGKTKVPTHQSYNEWDCTALFQATIFAKSFSMHHTTLSDLYVKPRAVPHGSFHGSVLSPSGNNAETFALAIDQLRRLRNTVCHSSRLQMDKAIFDQNIQYANEAFKALGISTASIDAIGSLTASDFPTTEVRKLEEQVKKENQAYIKCLENRNADMEEIRDFLTAIKQNVQILVADKEEVARFEQMIKDWKTEQRECNLAAETRVAENMTSAVGDLRVKLEETASKEDITALGNEIRELKRRQEERDREGETTALQRGNQGRSFSQISAASAPKDVGGKAPSRKRHLPKTEVAVHHSDTDADAHNTEVNFQAEILNPTTLVTRRAARPVDPPPSGPLVLKKIAGNIKKCAGCCKGVKSNVVGFQSPDDKLYCFARFEPYHFFNKKTNAWQLVRSTRHYHLNPVCTKVSSKIMSDNSLIVTSTLRQLVMDRFQCNLDL